MKEVESDRKAAAAQRYGSGPAGQIDRAKVDDTRLPRIVVRKIGPGGTIAGHETVKYQVESEGELFEELWVTNDLNLSADIDPKKFFDYQQKMSGARIGKAAAALRASFRSNDLRELYEKGLVVQTIMHHVAGRFERVTTDIKRAEIADQDFEIPDNYRRVRLADVFPAEGES